MTRGFSATRHGIPLLAISLLGFSLWSLASEYTVRTVTVPPVAAPANPYRAGVAGTGIVEPSSEMINLAIERGGVVSRIDVTAGATVRAGAPLLAIDDRSSRARVAETEAAATADAAEIDEIDQSVLLQKDMIAQSAANLDSAAAEVTRATLDRDRYVLLSRTAAATRQRSETADADLIKANAAHTAAIAARAAATRQNAVLNARRIEAVAKLAQARAVTDQARIDLDKTVVRAPIDGTVMKVNAHVGEYAAPGALVPPLMTMGATQTLHVRVDIDEADAWRVQQGGRATARLRGNASVVTPLTFVRFEPFILPKRSLTDASTERVDTRVLQAIYAYDPAHFPAYVGQQVDVFVESADTPQPGTPTASAAR